MDAGCVYLVNSVSAMPPIHPEKDSCLHGVCSQCGFLSCNAHYRPGTRDTFSACSIAIAICPVWEPLNRHLIQFGRTTIFVIEA
jgi:hypothetical protein